MRLRGLLVAGLLLALTAAGCTAAPSAPPVAPEASQDASATMSGRDDEIVVAIAGMVTPKEGLAYYEDLSAYVARKAGRKVHLIHKSDYAEVNSLLEHGKVDMAFVCSGPYVTGHDGFGLELLAVPVVGGKTTYRSYIIAAASSDATSLASLRGRTFAFTDPQSNSGTLVPRYLIAKAGGDPDTFFGKTFYTYGHDNSIKAVSTGAAAGAAVDSLIFEYQAAVRPASTASVRIIQRSDEYAIPPVVVRPGLAPAVKRALREAFVSADKDSAGAAILKNMRIDRFAEIDDAAYDSIREMAAWIERDPAPAP